MKNTSKTFKKTFSLVIALMMLFNMALVTSAAKSVDAELKWTADYENGTWETVDNSTENIFSAENFEPGSEIIRYFKISNTGSAAFEYDFNFTGEAKDLADVIDVYYSANVSENVTVEKMGDSIGKLSSVVGGNAISTGKILPNDLESEGYYTNEAIIAVALKMKDDAAPSYMGNTIGEGFYVSLNVTKDEEYTGYPLVDKFAVKLPEANFLYRVGNMNTVALGSLFKAIDGAEIENVTIETEAINSNVTAVYTANSSDWTKGTIQFTGTGPAKVTIVDDDYSTPVELIVEVIDAKNATSAASATANNVVLLNDISGTFTVSNGYTFYGNGFKLTLPNNQALMNKGNGYTGYVSLGAEQDDGVATGGNLDNVKIIGPVYPEAYMFRNQAEITNSNDPGYGDGSNMRYFANSVIIYGGNCTISNSYISGSRTALYVKGANNVLIENTTLSGGSLANLEVGAGCDVTLRDVTTVQKEAENSLGVTDDSGNIKTIIGMGVVLSKDSAKVTVEGEFNQYNWVNKAQWDATVPSTYANYFPKLFTDSKFEAYRHYKESDTTTPYVNTGVIAMCNWNNGANITDNRSDKTLTYTKTDVTLSAMGVTIDGGVYSVTNAGTLTDELYNAPEYVSEKQKAVAPIFKFDFTTLNNYPSDGVSNEYCYYDTASRKYMISFDEGNSRVWDGKILTLTKGGRNLDYNISVSGGMNVNEDKTITFDTAGDYTVTYTYTDEWNYQLTDGTIEKYPVTYTKTVDVTVFEIEAAAPPTEFDFLGKGYRTEVIGTTVYVMPDVTETVNSNTAGIRSTTIEGVTVYYPVVSMHKSGSSSWYNYFSVFEAVTIKDCDQTTVYNTSTTSMPSNLEVIGGFILNANGAVSTAESENGTKIFNYATGKEIKCATYSSYGLCYYPDSQFTKTGTSDRAEQTIVAKYRYTDSNGAQYYYYVGYWCEKHTKSTCITGDTLITLSDGSQKRMDAVTADDMLLVWDFYKGDYTVVPAAVVRNHGFDENNVITLKFSDGTVTKAVNEHGYFDKDLNKFVLFTAETTDDYIGHQFVKVGGDGYTTVELIECTVEQQYIEAYSILSAYHYNFITDGIFSISSSVRGLDYFMPFEYDDNLKIDEVKMNEDIEKYGLFTYEEFDGILSEAQFDVLNMPYIKISVGKGIITMEDLYVILNVEVLRKPLNDDEIPAIPDEPTVIDEDEEEIEDIPTALAETEEDGTTKPITSGVNTIKAATYAISVVPTNATANESGYVCTADEAKFAVTASGEATGYAIFTVDGGEYYTAAIENGDTANITIKNAKGQTVKVDALWGTHEKDTIENNTIDLGEFFVKETNPTDKGAKAVIANTTKHDRVDVNVYIAVYNKDTNRLVAVDTAKVTVKGNSEYTITVDVAMPANYEIKAFMWDADLKPVK